MTRKSSRSDRETTPKPMTRTPSLSPGSVPDETRISPYGCGTVFSLWLCQIMQDRRFEPLNGVDYWSLVQCHAQKCAFCGCGVRFLESVLADKRTQEREEPNSHAAAY